MRLGDRSPSLSAFCAFHFLPTILMLIVTHLAPQPHYRYHCLHISLNSRIHVPTCLLIPSQTDTFTALIFSSLKSIHHDRLSPTSQRVKVRLLPSSPVEWPVFLRQTEEPLFRNREQRRILYVGLIVVSLGSDIIAPPTESNAFSVIRERKY
jgi:hypothetical protein